MQHLDEGTIHAWLDGQLPPEEAQSVEAHVAECRPCADAVAEARGLIAASSRILTALDGAPREVVPKPASFRSPAEAGGTGAVAADGGSAAVLASRASERAQRRWFSGPSLAAAGVVVVAIGTVAIMRARQPTIMSREVSAVPAVSVPVADSTASASSAQRANDVGTALGDRRTASTAVPAPVPAAPAPPPQRTRDALSERADQPVRSEKASDEAAAGGARHLTTVQRPPLAEPAKAAQQQAAALAADLKKDVAADRAQRSGDSSAIVLRGQNALVQAAPPLADTTLAARAKTAAATASGSVRGRVLDGNGTGIDNVQVTVMGTNIGVVTSATGEYVLAGVTAGLQHLNVRRVGYQPAVRNVTITPGQTATADVVLNPATTALSEVVVTGTASAQRAATGSTIARAPAAPMQDSAPGAPITAAQSNAIGCYELGITSSAPSRTGFLQVPRRISLEADIVPANAEGIWYRARDLARVNALADGLWRPTAPNALVIEWTYGSKTGRVIVSGPPGGMLRGNVEEIDHATATGDAGTVVAIRRPCQN